MLFTRVTRGSGATSSSSCDFFSSLLLQISRFFSVLVFEFFGIVSFLRTTRDQIQFQSPVILFQINVIVPIRLKFKLHAVFIKWGCTIIFLFVWRQDLFKYGQFSSKICKNCYKRLVPKTARRDYWDMFVKTYHHHRLGCFEWFVKMTLLAVFFSQTLV